MGVRFSVITPVRVWNDYRKKVLIRAIKSVIKQTYQDYEHIVVDDGSNLNYRLPDSSKLKLYEQPHNERVAAYNLGFSKAKGKIFCLLDSDDEYEPNFLERVDYFFKRWPKYKMFNFGAKYKHLDGGSWLRDPFEPKKKKVGHKPFGGGTIVNGTFVFHRDIYNKLGAYPPLYLRKVDCTPINYGTSYGVKQPRDLFMATPYDFSAAAQMEFPEIRPFFMVDVESEPNKVIKELGNPWGNDYYLFYKYTRKYHSKPIREHLYVVHPKTGAE